MISIVLAISISQTLLLFMGSFCGWLVFFDSLINRGINNSEEFLANVALFILSTTVSVIFWGEIFYGT